MHFTLTISFLFLLLTYPQNSSNMLYTNSIDKDKMLIVITTPSSSDSYYKKNRKQIIDFQIAYAKNIVGHDNVVVLADAITIKELEKELPKDILLEQKLVDIWLRDCSMLNPQKPVQFRYAAAAQGGKQSDSDYVQKVFNAFAKKHAILFEKSRLILDGGNYVDNYKGRAIISTRFLKDNNLSYATAQKKLKKLLNLDQLAIIPTDEENEGEGLAHADGQLMFIDDNTIAVCDYKDPEYQKQLQKELETAFPEIKLVLLPTEFGKEDFDSKFPSACGIHVNSTVTKQYIYFPTFGKNTDQEALQLVQNNSHKTVIPIDASNVCKMGGSVRCLSWQLVGKNAEKLIEAARKN